MENTVMRPDHILWAPAVYEHKAALIGRTVAEVACSSDLLVEAIQAEHEAYHPDFLTVGIDVYNIEAEACGAEIVSTAPDACPEIPKPLFDLDNLPRELDIPSVPQAGRFEMLLQAGKRITEKLARHCAVRVAASGPMSIAAKLVGFEKLIMAIAMEEDSASRILQFCEQLSQEWCRCLRRSGLDAILFDSFASPPLISPQIYARTVLPMHRRIMSLLESLGQTERPLIIGGDTTVMLDSLAQSGANMLICDFVADAGAFADALGRDETIRVRRNIDPKILSAGPQETTVAADRLQTDLRLFAKPVAGTGILPYNSDPERFRQFRRLVDNNVR